MQHLSYKPGKISFFGRNWSTLVTLLVFNSCCGQMPGPVDVLQTQLQTDLTAVQVFMQSVSTQAAIGTHIEMWLKNPKPGLSSHLRYIQSIHAYENRENVFIEIQFQSSKENPFISPNLAGKKLRFKALDIHANPWQKMPPKKNNVTFQPRNMQHKTMRNIEQKLKSIHSNQELLDTLDQVRADILQNESTKTQKDIIQHNHNNTSGIFGYSCERIADSHGFYFAEIYYPTGNIDVFSQLPTPYNICLKKSKND